MKRLIVFFYITICCSNIIFASDLYTFVDKRQEAQFQHLLTNLRCPVCQNQDLADSNAPLAKDLRGEVFRLVNLAKTDDEIITYLTDRYGDFILFKPRFKSITYVLWISPIIFGIIGFLVFYFST